MTEEAEVQSIGFADLSAWRKVAVTGADALEWLNDLVSADVSALSAQTSRQSLLLSPTGQIRAEFTAARLDGDSFLLIQDPDQPSAIDRLLDPYTLSSDVELTDRTADLHLFAFPDLGQEPARVGGTWLRPSVLGPGLDLLTETPVTLSTTMAISKLSSDELERRRIRRGSPQYGVDALESDLPQEAGLGDAVAFDKGCYLGQEAVAKVRNLGHPRRLLVRIETEAETKAGDPLFADGKEVGRITSAVQVDSSTVGLAKVQWAARDSKLKTEEGAELEARPLP